MDMKTSNDHDLFMKAAEKAALDSNCLRKQVGCAIVLNGVILLTAYNGTPEGIKSCKEGGCERCLSNASSGESYDSCLCIHAEQLAISVAASSGIPIKGASIYCTLRPCLTCLNICLHAGITEIIYKEHIQFRTDMEKSYVSFIDQTKMRLTRYS